MFNKKGVMKELGTLLVMFFIFLVFIGASYYIWTQFVAQVNLLDADIASDRIKSEIEDMGRVFVFIDLIVPFIFLTLWGLTLWFSLKETPEHPIFFIAGFGVLMLMTLLSIFLVDFGTQFFQNTLFDGIQSDISNALFFVYKFHYVSFGIMLLTLVIQYSKNRMALTRGIE